VKTRFVTLCILILTLLVPDARPVAGGEAAGTAPADGTPLPPPAAAAGNVELVGQLGGVTGGLDSDGVYVYRGVGPRVVILDVTDPTAPFEIGRTSPLPGFIEGLAVAGDYLYVAALGAGLRVIDVSDRGAPVEVGFLPTMGSAMAVVVEGDYAYVANGPGGLLIADISNPATPLYVSLFDALVDVQHLAVVGNYAYLADGGWLRIVDVSDPSAPVGRGVCPFGSDSEGMAARKGLVYVAAHGAGLRIIDGSDPDLPREVGLYRPAYSLVWDVVVVGDLAYVACDHGAIHVLDISDPADPTCVGMYGLIAAIDRLVVVGDYAYVTYYPADLRVFDISDPTAVAEMSTYSDSYQVLDAAVVGDYAALAAGRHGLRLVDVSVPTMPVEVGAFLREIPPPHISLAYSVAAAGDYAYVDYQALRVIDISSPANPIEVQSIPLLYSHLPMQVAGNYLYVAGDYGLRIMDLSDPAAPREVGSLVYMWPYLVRFRVAGGYAYLISEKTIPDEPPIVELSIVDVSIPAAPVEIGQVGIVSAPQDVSVTGGYAYVADGGVGLWSIDVTDPYSPTAVALHDTPGVATRVTVADDYAYVGDGDALRVVDVWDPAYPHEVGFYKVPGSVAEVRVVGGYVYVVDLYAGLLILRFTPPRPELAIDPAVSAPGSYLNLSGTGFGPTTKVALSVNGAELGAVVADASGAFTVTLSTDSAEEGLYLARAAAHTSATVRFVLDAAAAIRPRQGDWSLFEVPPGVAYTHAFYLPAALR
jgi:hypothetical protein